MTPNIQDLQKEIKEIKLEIKELKEKKRMILKPFNFSYKDNYKKILITNQNQIIIIIMKNKILKTLNLYLMIFYLF